LPIEVIDRVPTLALESVALPEATVTSSVPTLFVMERMPAAAPVVVSYGRVPVNVTASAASVTSNPADVVSK
jgi:hypothetical protein